MERDDGKREGYLAKERLLTYVVVTRRYCEIVREIA